MSPLHSIAITPKESDRCKQLISHGEQPGGSLFAELISAKKVVRVRKLTEAVSPLVVRRFIVLLPSL
ncbi:hypothetical protein FIBSPDRAFT_861670 [Athelia psychrophila]|uniref:Uncharacterized protein n=1 Tax=Athelia psychrophila TaxID=1759441 RepID=A0A166J2Z0_9AGAM|nr:hypothetical protein FIBSPDRAFT_861670 [Fibularhizoctonia sp. CBS 109695]